MDTQQKKETRTIFAFMEIRDEREKRLAERAKIADAAEMDEDALWVLTKRDFAHVIATLVATPNDDARWAAQHLMDILAEFTFTDENEYVGVSSSGFCDPMWGGMSVEDAEKLENIVNPVMPPYVRHGLDDNSPAKEFVSHYELAIGAYDEDDDLADDVFLPCVFSHTEAIETMNRINDFLGAMTSKYYVKVETYRQYTYGDFENSY